MRGHRAAARQTWPFRRTVVPVRPPASLCRPSGRRWASWMRSPNTISMRWSASLRAVNSSARSESMSAHCASSTTSTIGVVCPSSVSASRTRAPTILGSSGAAGVPGPPPDGLRRSRIRTSAGRSRRGGPTPPTAPRSSAARRGRARRPARSRSARSCRSPRRLARPRSGGYRCGPPPPRTAIPRSRPLVRRAGRGARQRSCPHLPPCRGSTAIIGSTRPPLSLPDRVMTGQAFPPPAPAVAGRVGVAHAGTRP